MRLYSALTRAAVAGALLGSFVSNSSAQTAGTPPSAAAPAQPAASPAGDTAVALPMVEVVGQKKKPKRKPSPVAAAAKAAAEGGSGAAPPAEAFPEGPVAASSAPGRYSDEQRAAYGATGSVNYISGEAISRFSGTSPADFLRGVPGVTIGETRNGGGIDANIRGMQGQRRIAVTVDGADSTIDTYRGYAGTQQRTYIDPDLIGGATISKGPSASQGAIGGTIAMTTINAEDILRAGQSMGVRVRGGIASNSTAEPTEFAAKPETRPSGLFDPEAGNGSLAFAIRQPGFDIVGGYAVRDQGNYFAGREGRDFYRRFTHVVGYGTYENFNTVGKQFREGEEVLNSSVETKSLLLKTVLRPSSGHTLELGVRGFGSEMGEIMPSQILRNSNEFVPQWRPGYYNTETWTGSYKWRPADNDLIDLKVSGFYSNFDSDAFNNPAGEGPRPFYLPTDEGSDPGYRVLYGARMETIRYGFDVANTSRLATGLGKLKIDYGLSAEREDLHPDDGNFPISEDDINNGRFLRSGVRDQINTFGNVEWKPIRALTLEAGSRYTHAELRDRNRKPIKGTGPKYCSITYREPRRITGTLRWPADANGQCTAATDPRRDPNSWVLRNSGDWVRLGRYLVEYPVVNAANPTIDGVFEDADSVAVGFEKAIEREDEGFAGTASATLELFQGTKLYARYAEGVRLPGIFESTTGYFAATPNEVLDPEHAKNWEFGASTVQSKLLTERDEGMLKFAYFDNTVKDFISRFYEPKFDLTTGQDLTTFNFENNDSFRARGLELQATYDAGIVFFDGSVTKYLEATTCNAKRAESIRKDPNAQYYPDYRTTPNCIAGGFRGSFTNIQNPPEYSVTVTGGVRLFDERLTLGGRYMYNSEPIAKLDKQYHGVQGGLSMQQTYDKPVVLVDLFSSLKVTEDSEFTFGVDNVANRYYIDPLTVSFMPSPGRTYKAGFSAKF